VGTELLGGVAYVCGAQGGVLDSYAGSTPGGTTEFASCSISDCTATNVSHSPQCHMDSKCPLLTA